MKNERVDHFPQKVFIKQKINIFINKENVTYNHFYYVDDFFFFDKLLRGVDEQISCACENNSTDTLLECLSTRVFFFSTWFILLCPLFLSKYLLNWVQKSTKIQEDREALSALDIL